MPAEIRAVIGAADAETVHRSRSFIKTKLCHASAGVDTGARTPGETVCRDEDGVRDEDRHRGDDPVSHGRPDRARAAPRTVQRSVRRLRGPDR